MIEYLNEDGFTAFKINTPNLIQIPSNALYIFAYIESGSLKDETSSGTYEASSGELIFVPVDLNYSLNYRAGDKGACYGWCLIARFFIGVNKWNYPPQVITATPEIIAAAKDLPANNIGIDFKKNCNYMRRIFTFMDLVEKQLKKNDIKGTDIIEKAIDFMNRNERFSVPDVARYCNVSESYLFKIFNKYANMSPVKMKQKIQAEKGEMLLRETTLTVDEIANKSGFDSTAHFRKVFESRFFCSPKEYRKKLNK